MNNYDDYSLFEKDIRAAKFRLKLKKGANPNIMKFGDSVLNYLIIYESKFDVLLDKVKALFEDERTDVNKCDNYGHNPLHNIIERTFKYKESLEVLNYILKDKRTKVNIANKGEWTELIFCVYYFNKYHVVRVDIFDRLLKDKRIIVNLDNCNYSALDYLFQYNFTFLKERKECLKLLLKRKEINFNNIDSNGNTVLMRLLLRFENKEEEEKFDYFELKDIIIILLTDSRTDIVIKTRFGRSVKNITNDFDFLKIIAQKY